MSDETVETARSRTELVALCERIKAIPSLPREGVDVFVRRHKVRRTVPQNSRMWWLHNLEAAHLNKTWPERAATMIALMEQAGAKLDKLERAALLGKVWNKDDVHEEYCKRYCYGGSSTKPAKLDFMAHLDDYEADLRTAGVEFPEE